jgi:hypothetical protein
MKARDLMIALGKLPDDAVVVFRSQLPNACFFALETVELVQMYPDRQGFAYYDDVDAEHKTTPVVKLS